MSRNTNLATNGSRPALHECVVQGILQADWCSFTFHDRLQEPEQRAQRSSEQQLSVLLRSGSAYQKDWWKRRKMAIMKLNSTKQERLGMSPIEAERGVMGLLLRSLYKMLPVIQSKPAHDNYMALVARLMRTCLQIAARLVA